MFHGGVFDGLEITTSRSDGSSGRQLVKGHVISSLGPMFIVSVFHVFH
jgi:hypothetical protein